jgi:prepilin-type N-terminal cleavage/methylation domain-containing protein
MNPAGAITGPRSRGSMARHGGFTLIELLAVIAIMMILVAGVTTNIDMIIPSTRIEASARILASDIAAARSSAIAQGLAYRIEYDINNTKYRIATPFRGDGGIATDDEDRSYTDWRTFPDNVKIDRIIAGTKVYTSGIHRVELQPNGNTIEHVIDLKRELPEGRFYLAVQGLTGFVQFYGADWMPETVDDSSFP